MLSGAAHHRRPSLPKHTPAVGKGISPGWYEFVTRSDWPPFLGWDGEQQNQDASGFPVCVGMKGQGQEGEERRIILERNAFYMYIYAVIKYMFLSYKFI